MGAAERMIFKPARAGHNEESTWERTASAKDSRFRLFTLSLPKPRMVKRFSLRLFKMLVPQKRAPYSCQHTKGNHDRYSKA